MHVETVEAGQWWARPRGAQSQDWVGNYQRSLQSRHRTVIANIVKGLQPKTILELGSHCGPNLVRLAQELPTLKCLGVDINAGAVEAGQQWLKDLGLSDRVELHAGEIPASIADVPSGSIDVVLSCYTLAYVAPSDLDAVLYEMGRIAKTAVIVAEPMTTEGQATQRRSLSGYSEWAHNYAQASRWIGTWRGRAQRSVAVEPPVDQLKSILVIETLP